MFDSKGPLPKEFDFRCPRQRDARFHRLFIDESVWLWTLLPRDMFGFWDSPPLDSSRVPSSVNVFPVCKGEEAAFWKRVLFLLLTCLIDEELFYHRKGRWLMGKQLVNKEPSEEECPLKKNLTTKGRSVKNLGIEGASDRRWCFWQEWTWLKQMTQIQGWFFVSEFSSPFLVLCVFLKTYGLLEFFETTFFGFYRAQLTILWIGFVKIFKFWSLN